jgi:radical SAM superfamily enzyme YgiQ (UPF0313 family)
MKVLLITPPFYRLLGGHNNWVSLGVSYIGAVLVNNGFEVKIYNADHVDNAKELNLREVFEGSKIAKSILNDDNHPIWEEIIETVKGYNPDIVGISINFSMIAKSGLKIAELIKQWNPNVKIVVGGPHASILPDETLSDKNIDFLVRHEGEYAMLELLQGKDIVSIEGLSYKDRDGRIIHNEDRKFIEDLDSLPFSKLELQLKEISDPENNFGIMATSRGCPFSCVFCTSPKLWGKKVRFRSISNVIEEIKWRYYNYGVKKYYFSDDNFNLERERAIMLCREIIKSNIDIKWSCEVQIRNLPKDLLEAMKDAGCKRIKLGVESASDRILKLMKKETTREQIKKVVKLIKGVGIDITTYVLIGMPTETVNEMLETYYFIEELDPAYLSLSIASPQYGTELFNMMQERGISFSKKDWFEHFHQSYKTVLNSNVNKDIIDKFLSFNEKKGFARTI